MATLQVREYGTAGPTVVVLHGGPAAAGSAAPLARGLGRSYRALEPWQRGSGEQPLTVASHIADLHQLLESRCSGERPALVGESWGAMLALAYAAAHPDHAGPLVLIGCGTFDPAARARLQANIDQRIDDDLRQRLDRLPEEFPDPDRRLMQRYELTRSLYSYDPVAPDSPDEDEFDSFDLRAHQETWADMVRLQVEGVYPAAFAAIQSPAIMLHGADDPHPGQIIHAGLKPYLPQLQYHEWERCGHSPWTERWVREEFFAVMRDWLERHLQSE